MPSLLFAEQFYYPDGWGGAQIPRDITMHLARAGFDVRVLCGSDPYAPVEGDPGVDPSTAGVRIVRLPRLFGGDIHSRKLLRQLWFYLLALPTLLFCRRPDVFVIQTNPPLLVAIAAFSAWLRRIPLAIIAQDLYPEVLFAHGALTPKSLPGRLLRGIFSKAYRSAATVISLGPTMSRRLLAKGVDGQRVQIVCNWATGQEGVVRGAQNELRRQWQLQDRFVVLYSGNLGIAHEIAAVLEGLARAVRIDPRIRLVLIGKGSRLLEAQTLVKQLELSEYVLFKSLVPAELLPHSLGLADVALVTLRPGFEGLVVPSKLLGYMARGVPTAYIGPSSDISALIEESHGGVNLIDARVEAIGAELVRLAANPGMLQQMGQNAQRFYDERLTRERALQRYEEIMAVLSRKPGSRSES